MRFLSDIETILSQWRILETYIFKFQSLYSDIFVCRYFARRSLHDHKSSAETVPSKHKNVNLLK